MYFTHLPSPEEGVFEGIHAGQREIEQSVLGILVPALPVIPGGAIGVRRGVRLYAPQVEAAVIKAVAVLSGDSDAEATLTGKSWSTSWQREEQLMMAYIEFIMPFQAVQAFPGQIPPILPSGAGTLMGSMLGVPPNAK